MILYDWPANARFGVYAGHYTTGDPDDEEALRSYAGTMRRQYRYLRQQGAEPDTIRTLLNAALFAVTYGDGQWVADLREVRS